MNSEYLLWFVALVVVTGSVLLWLAIGEVPEVPIDPELTSERAAEAGSAEPS